MTLVFIGGRVRARLIGFGNLTPAERRAERRLARRLTRRIKLSSTPCSPVADNKNDGAAGQVAASSPRLSRAARAELLRTDPVAEAPAPSGPVSADVGAVIRVLREADYSVARAGLVDGETKWSVDGRRLLTARELLDLANRVRRRRRQPALSYGM